VRGAALPLTRLGTLLGRGGTQAPGSVLFGVVVVSEAVAVAEPTLGCWG